MFRYIPPPSLCSFVELNTIELNPSLIYTTSHIYNWCIAVVALLYHGLPITIKGLFGRASWYSLRPKINVIFGPNM